MDTIQRAATLAMLTAGTVKKSKAEAKAQKADHAAKEKLRLQRRKEQEANVQRKKAALEGDKKGKNAGEDEDDEDGENDEDLEPDEEMASAGEEDLSGDDADDGEGAWDDEEMISEGEGEDESGSESEEEAPRPPPKKLKTKSKR